MTHKEFIREIPGSTTVALCIHGILGTPNQFNHLIPQIPSDWSVFNILLDGHGKGVQDFAHSSMNKWKGQIQRTLTYLSVRYDKIIILAHSMGTLFAIQEATRNHHNIKALFLIDVPLITMLRPWFIQKTIRIVQGRVPADDIIGKSIEAGWSIKFERRPWPYLGWIPRFAELFEEVERTKKCIPKLNVPTRIFLSQKDEMISLRSYRYLKQNRRIKVSVLNDATHFYFNDKHNAIMQMSLANICRKIDSL